jgi:hypothetical protein
MESQNARKRRDTLLASQTYRDLPPHLKSTWLNKAIALGASSGRPLNDEIFESKDHCLKRLNDWGFIEGCAYVTTRHRKEGTPNWTFACIFHSTKSQNNWDLDARVVKEGEVIVSKRKRNSYNHRLGCQCEYFLSYKNVSRAIKEKVYMGKWRQAAHQGHEIALNPFSFSIHKSASDEFQQLQAVATKYRLCNQPFSEASKLLKQEGLGLIMKKKEYYNLIRYRKIEKTNPDTIVALLQALDDQGFTYRTLTSDEYEEDGFTVSTRKLQQIFFFFSEGLELCRRFCAGHLLLIDATFNTNRQRLPILVAVGITNEGKSFPVAYSYCPSESAASFSFFFECLQQEVFPTYNGIPAPAVILADQAAGLIKAVDKDDTLPYSQLQFCSWHATQAIIAKLRKGKYTSDELDGYKDIWGNAIAGLKDLIWWYIESPTLGKLELNRQHLLDRLDPADQAYINDYWVKKEDRVVRAYTRHSKNLGCFATQRVESYHRIIQSVTNSQMPLENAVKSIAERTADFYRVLAEDEDRARVAQRTDIDRDVFRALIGRVSLRAIDLIKPEWRALSDALIANEDIGTCDCDILLQNSLPCRHLLLQCAIDAVPIPITLVHPRWWLKGPAPGKDWEPLYTRQPVVISPKQVTVRSAFAELIDQRQTLQDPEQLSRFDFQAIQVAQDLQAIAAGQQLLNEVPIAPPDAIPKPVWVRRIKPTLNSRGMTVNEAMAARERLAVRATTKRKRDERILQERATAAASQMSIGSTIECATRQDDDNDDNEDSEDSEDDVVITTPMAPTPLILRSHSLPPWSPNSSPPPSTAPAILGRGKRQRKRTDRKQEAIAAGLLNDSQQHQHLPK